MSGRAACEAHDDEAGATVVDLSRRRRQESPVSAVPEPDEACVRLARTMQALCRDRGLSLADPETAAAWAAAMDAAKLIVDGALSQGLVGADAHAAMAGMLSAAQEAPHRL